MSAEWRKGLRCLVTGNQYPSLIQIKNGISDFWNILPLVYPLAEEYKKHGLSYMAAKYPPIAEFLLDQNWDTDDKDRWDHYEDEY